jgi:hypothetical protein
MEERVFALPLYEVYQGRVHNHSLTDIEDRPAKFPRIFPDQRQLICGVMTGVLSSVSTPLDSGAIGLTRARYDLRICQSL